MGTGPGVGVAWTVRLGQVPGLAVHPVAAGARVGVVADGGVGGVLPPEGAACQPPSQSDAEPGEVVAGVVTTGVRGIEWIAAGVGVAVPLDGVGVGVEGPAVLGGEGAAAGLVPAGVHVDEAGGRVGEAALVAEVAGGSGGGGGLAEGVVGDGRGEGRGCGGEVGDDVVVLVGDRQGGVADGAG